MTARVEMTHFLMVGALNFVFTFAVFTTALKLFHLDHLLSLLMAWIAGNLLTYVLNFLFVFRPEVRLTFGARFVKYLLAGGVSIGFNLVLLFVLVDLAGFDAFWSQVAIMPFIVAFNFVAAKFWSLRKSGVAP